MDLYIDALTAEMAALGKPQPMRTLYLGGGTPTHLSGRQLDRLLTAIRRWLPPEPGHEWSVEANPGTLDRDKTAIMAEHGVNRVSLGAQSFNPRMLRTLERNHDPEDVSRAVDLLRGRIGQVSLDLIFGVPGQTLKDWAEDLRSALNLEPDHLSTYGLTFEKGTRLWKQQQQGQVRALDEETELALYEYTMDALAAAGFDHYEISSFARPGQRCRHNQVYWANHAYFGFGVGAARYVGGCRELNTRDLYRYLRKTLAGEPATFQSETLSPEERARETITLQLRRAEGIERQTFSAQTGFELDEMVGSALVRNVELGLLADDGSAVRLTRRGKCVADALIQGFL
jgi:oxygen-independent coproporphyrinogen-3 oxidase